MQTNELLESLCVYKIHNFDIYAICPVEWREISTKQSVGKCNKLTSRIFVYNFDISVVADDICRPNLYSSDQQLIA